MNVATQQKSSGTKLVNILLGAWVVISPFVFGLGHDKIALGNNILLGIAFVLVALAGDWAHGGFLGLTVPLGIWLFLWPFIFLYWGPILWSNLAVTFALITVTALTDGLRIPPASSAQPKR